MNIAEEMIDKMDQDALMVAIRQLYAAAYETPEPATIVLVGCLRGDVVAFETRCETEVVRDREAVLHAAAALSSDQHAVYCNSEAYMTSRDAAHDCAKALQNLRDYAATLEGQLTQKGADVWMAGVRDADRELDALQTLRFCGVQYRSKGDYIRAAFDPSELLTEEEAEALFDEVLARVQDRVAVDEDGNEQQG